MERFESWRSRDGNHELVRVENGQATVLRTDSETDVIRKVVEQHIEDYGMKDRVTSQVTDAGGGWTRIEVTYPANLTENEWVGLPTDLDIAFSNHTKDWYECRESGGNDDRTIAWWVVKHRCGPWV